MPLYEFHCEHCGKDSEVLVRSTQWEGTPCPKCGSIKLTKKFSTFASNAAGAASEAPRKRKAHSCGMCGTGKPHSH